MNKKTKFWKKFFQYSVIGLSAILLLAGVQQGAFIGKNWERGPVLALAQTADEGDGTSETTFVSSEPISEQAVPIGDGTAETTFVSSEPIQGQAVPPAVPVPARPAAAAPNITEGPDCDGAESVWARFQDGVRVAILARHGFNVGNCGVTFEGPDCEGTHGVWVRVVNGERQILKDEGPIAECGGGAQAAPAAPAPAALTCQGPNPDRSTPEPNCNKAGAPLGLCCTVCGNSRCDKFNGENEINCPADCAPGTAQPAAAQAQGKLPCEIALAEGRNICGDNSTFCENPTPSGPGSMMIFKHNGRCDPSNGESRNDPRGCVFDFTALQFFPEKDCKGPAQVQPPAAGGTTNVNPNINVNPNVNVNPNINVNPHISTGNVTLTSNPTIVNTVTNTAPQAEVVPGNVGVGTSIISQVAGVQVQALPKTGLPALAWVAFSFVPSGFGLKRFGKLNKDAASSPNFLWEDRQFKAGA